MRGMLHRADVNLERDFLGLRLVRRYGRWMLGYLAVLLAAWALGIEASYENPTPFYALLHAASPVLAVPLTVMFAVAVLLLAAWAVYRGDRRLFLRGLSGLLVLGAGFAALTVALHGFGEGARKTAEDGLTWLIAGQALPWVVFILALAGLVAALHRLEWFKAESLSPRAVGWFVVGAIAFSIVFSAAVAMMRGGTLGITQAYDRYDMEYIGDIGFGGSLKGLFAQYVPRHEYLTSMHSKVHPPGPVALLWILSFVAGRESAGLAWATIAVGSLAVVPLFFWVRDLLGTRVAVTTCVLYTLVPSIVLFTATSADALFMPFTLLTLFLFDRAIARSSIPYAIGAGVMYAVISLLSFSLLAVGAYFGFVGLWRLIEPRHRWAVLQTAVVMLAVFLVWHLAVRLWSGFDMIESFRLAKAQFDTDQFNLDRFGPRYPAWTWRILNPLAWFYFAGIPVSLLCLRRLRRPEPATKALFIVFALTFVALDLLYLARGEGERSALYVFPFVLVPAAHLLDGLGYRARSASPLAATAAFLAFQCWFTEAFFYTYW